MGGEQVAGKHRKRWLKRLRSMWAVLHEHEELSRPELGEFMEQELGNLKFQLDTEYLGIRRGQ